MDEIMNIKHIFSNSHFQIHLISLSIRKGGMLKTEEQVNGRVGI